MIACFFCINHIHPERSRLTDTGYQGIYKLHQNSALPKEKTKKNPLIKEEKKKNRSLSSERILNEKVKCYQSGLL
jgi:hypothetical protein